MDVFDDRKSALEEEFFRKQNDKLVAGLKAERERGDARTAMAASSGISDEAVLDKLIDQGVTPASFAALSLVPLVAVAWADRKLEKKEKEAVLEQAAALGMTAEMDGYSLLEGWLEEAPSGSLLETWREYAKALSAEIDPGELGSLREMLLERTESVAKAAGGTLGMGSKVSAEEKRVLDIVASALGG